MALSLQQNKPLGSFVEKEYGHCFEFTSINENYFKEAGCTHMLAVGGIHTDDRYYRGAKILKTVAYVLVDQDDNGEKVWQKWDIKNHTLFNN